MKISLIVAAAQNNVIGRNNDLPWKLPDDMKHFVNKTKGHHILTGRKNFESFGKVLPNRPNLIVTRDPSYTQDGAHVFPSILEAINFAKTNGENELMIIGGGEIYKQCLAIAECIYLTRVDAEIEGDTFFPALREEEWKMVKNISHPADDRHAYSFSFQEFQRIA